ncbi:MAG: hypothetical protein ACI9TV_002301, partial [Sulfurimonas sp.]
LSLIQVKSVAPIKIKKSRSRVIGRNKKQGTSTPPILISSAIF